jgi:hypothetical protein
VLTYLAEELRTGDIAVAGAQAYANWADQLLSPAQCAELLPAFCAEVGLPRRRGRVPGPAAGQADRAGRGVRRGLPRQR